MLVLREHILGNLTLIPTDQRVGSLYNQLCRAIVLFQFEETCILILRLEVKDIVDVGPTKRVDALSIITHNAHFLTLFRQLIDDGLLCVVGVLILIDQYELKLLYIFLSDILVVLEQHPRLHQQIVEVHRIRLTAPFRVPYIYS